ncbi:MAG TPA: biotin/lipoyl-containing protein [Anaerolineae bacterium]
MSNIGVVIDGRSYTVDLKLDQRKDSELDVVVNGETLRVVAPDLNVAPERDVWVIVDGRPYEVLFDRDLHWIKAHGGLHRLEVHDVDAWRTRTISGDARVKAPIPGLVTRILVKVGDEVTAGQPLLVLEAMKMENEIRAPRRGQVSHLNVKPGQNVTLHHLLAEIA